LLNPRQIEAFRAVMVTGSVKSAATTMHVTQPAVSRLIRDLQLTLKLALLLSGAAIGWSRPPRRIICSPRWSAHS
jgi:DNA-binding transcriptional LysR family regulator